MSSLVDLTRNTESVQGFQIVTQADMFTALNYISTLTAANYGGMIQVDPGGTNWKLLINNTTANTSQFAEIGDWIILQNNAIVTVCKQANFAALYDQS